MSWICITAVISIYWSLISRIFFNNLAIYIVIIVCAISSIPAIITHYVIAMRQIANIVGIIVYNIIVGIIVTWVSCIISFVPNLLRIFLLNLHLYIVISLLIPGDLLLFLIVLLWRTLIKCLVSIGMLRCVQIWILTLLSLARIHYTLSFIIFVLLPWWLLLLLLLRLLLLALWLQLALRTLINFRFILLFFFIIAFRVFSIGFMNFKLILHIFLIFFTFLFNIHLRIFCSISFKII